MVLKTLATTSSHWGILKGPAAQGTHHVNLLSGPGLWSLFLAWTKKMVPLRRRFPFCQTHQPLLGSPVVLMPCTPALARPWNTIPTSPCLGLKCSQFYCTVLFVPKFLSLASKPLLSFTLKLGTLQAVLCTPLMCHPLCGFNDIWYWLPTLGAQPSFLWILIQLLSDLLWHLLYTIQLITPLFPHINKW